MPQVNKKIKSPYSRGYSEIYDILYRDKPYAQEAVFVHRRLQEFKKGRMHSLLELGCGTGSHALELGKLGYRVTATDRSGPMLSIARKKFSGAASGVDFRHQDMRSLKVARGSFDAAVSLFDAIGYVLTNEALMLTLRGIHRALRPRGLLMLEFWHGAAMLLHYEPLRVRCLKTPRGSLLRISETSLDHARQLGKVDYTTYLMNGNNKRTIIRETHANRYFFTQEMAAFLSVCGFTPLKFYPGFARSGAIDEKTWHIVALARRSG